MNKLDHIFSIAPMMDWTDRHKRAFLRTISQCTLLYTEMVTAGAILRGGQGRFFGFDESEHPVALQLCGSEPGHLAICDADSNRIMLWDLASPGAP